MMKKLFSRRWLLTTFLVVIAAAVMARLGIWQLDRLDQRRAFNARVLAQLEADPLALSGEALDADLYNMEYRTVRVVGEYDPAGEIGIRNQVYNGQWGAHLVTPLRIQDSDRAVLVDRGWIPGEDFEAGDWSQYNEPGTVTVEGVIRRPQERADYGGRSDPTPAPGEVIKAWNFVNVDAIGRQTPEDLLPVYIQQAPEPGWQGLPYRTEPELEITEGPHMGYAIQWFGFATLLLIGYPFFVRSREAAQPENRGGEKKPVGPMPNLDEAVRKKD